MPRRPRAPRTSPLIRRHYTRALDLSQGRSASVYLAYAEAVSVPLQNGAEFRELIAQALAVDPDADAVRIGSSTCSRTGGRTGWRRRVDELILESDAEAPEGR